MPKEWPNERFRPAASIRREDGSRRKCRCRGGFANRLGKLIIFGIRPEHLSDEVTDHIPVTAPIEISEPMGSESIVCFKAATGNLIARVPGEHLYHPGERPTVQLKMDKVHGVCSIPTGEHPLQHFILVFAHLGSNQILVAQFLLRTQLQVFLMFGLAANIEGVVSWIREDE
jgi:hypothetical protein